MDSSRHAVMSRESSNALLWIMYSPKLFRVSVAFGFEYATDVYASQMVFVYRGLRTLKLGTGGSSLSSLLGVVLAVVPGDSPTRGLLLTRGVVGNPSSSILGLLLTRGVLGVPTLPTLGVLPELLLLPNPLFIIFPSICTSSAASSNMSSSMPSCAL